MSVGSTTEYVQRKFPASGWMLTDTGSSPALAGVATTPATSAAANRRAIQVRRIMWSSSVKGDSGRTLGGRHESFRPHDRAAASPSVGGGPGVRIRAAHLGPPGVAVNRDFTAAPVGRRPGAGQKLPRTCGAGQGGLRGGGARS